MVNFWSLAFDLFADSDLLVDVRSEPADWTVSRLFSTCCGGQWRLHTALWSLYLSNQSTTLGEISLCSSFARFGFCCGFPLSCTGSVTSVCKSDQPLESVPFRTDKWQNICLLGKGLIGKKLFWNAITIQIEHINVITKTVYLTSRKIFLVQRQVSSQLMARVGRALLFLWMNQNVGKTMLCFLWVKPIV